MTGLKGEFYWEQSRLIKRKTDFAAQTEDLGHSWVCKPAPKRPPERPDEHINDWASVCLQDAKTGARQPTLLFKLCRMGPATPDWLRGKISKLVLICNRWFYSCSISSGQTENTCRFHPKSGYIYSFTRHNKTFTFNLLKTLHVKSYLQAAAWFHLCHSVWTACTLKIEFCPSGDHSKP